MEMICSSETSAEFQQTTSRYTPEDSTIQKDRCEKLNLEVKKQNSLSTRLGTCMSLSRW
jgi:hypothetical protein